MPPARYNFYSKGRKTHTKAEFGSLTVFAINGHGIPFLQRDQLNIIVHHLTAINSQRNTNISYSVLCSVITYYGLIH